jgi:hypothetical protein
MKEQTSTLRLNRSVAKDLWGQLSRTLLRSLEYMTIKYGLSVALGDLLQIDGRWYVTHSGLVRTAQRRRCHGIETSLLNEVSDPVVGRWVFKATVYKTPGSRGFVGYGDADPSNVSSLVRGAEMRVAETRAVDRALRQAYGIGLCSVEELGSSPSSPRPAAAASRSHESFLSNGSGNGNGNGHGNGNVRLRDQLSVLIRKYDLDPTRVKRYAADFCGTDVLRDAGRESVESFIATLADQAAKDRSGLICKLNSYGLAEAVKS